MASMSATESMDFEACAFVMEKGSVKCVGSIGLMPVFLLGAPTARLEMRQRSPHCGHGSRFICSLVLRPFQEHSLLAQ